MHSREVTRALQRDGWQEVRVHGDHHIFRHPTKPGRVIVPHPVRGHTDRHTALHRSTERINAEATMKYIAIIHHDPGSAFGVSFPDFPGCITAGESFEKAKARAAEVLRLCVEDMAAAGEALPVPSAFEAVMQNPDFADGVAFFVTIGAAAAAE
jgi:predicted RNase H-like HicB family nuclease/predicted RNA binding protein YcfA (HicA-like mRNA interferase family)